MYLLKLTQCPYSDKGFIKISEKILKYIYGKQRTISIASFYKKKLVLLMYLLRDV